MEVLVRLATTHLPGLRSLILGGSFARGEGTLVRVDSRWVPYKDYDLFAVVRDAWASRAAGAIPMVRRLAYERLGYPRYEEDAPSPTRFHIGIAIIPEGALRRLPPDVSNVELALTGKTLWGVSLLDRLPSDPSLIPAVSALRPVLNKLIGLVEMWGSEASPDAGRAIAYERAKIVLDAVSAVLVLHGAWVPGYAARNEVLREKEGEGPLLPSVGPLARRAEEALSFKLHPADPPHGPEVEWAMAREELLSFLEPLCAETLGFPAATGPQALSLFARHAPVGLFLPFALDAVHRRGLAMGPSFASALVRAYALWENLRLGTLSLVHPLVRAWAAAWAWLLATRDEEEAKHLLAWARLIAGRATDDRVLLRRAIVRLFKASSTARRSKRTL